MGHSKEIQIILSKLKERGSERDFRRLYDLLYNRFFRIAFYYLQKDEWAQEVALDVFLTLWNKRRELSEIKNFENYSFILLKNASLNYIEKNKSTAENLDDCVETTPDNITPESNLLNEELFLVYLNALEELPPKCREVFVLIREDGLSYKEVADKLGISVKTVDAQLQKAVARLKDKIKTYFTV